MNRGVNMEKLILIVSNFQALWNNFQTNIQDAGTKLSEIGKDISQNVQSKIAELNKDDEKKN